MKRTLLSLAAALTLVQWSQPAALAQAGPQGGAGTVTMSRTEYDRLLDLASRKPVTDTTPAAALTRADLRVRVAGPSARATMRVDSEVFRAGVAKVTLIKNATVLEATMDNRPLPVVAEGGGHVALVAGPAAFSATLEIGAALSFSPGRGAVGRRTENQASGVMIFDARSEQRHVGQ